MIRLSHIMKKYDNITPIKDIDAEIKTGEVVAIIGPSWYRQVYFTSNDKWFRKAN